MRTLLKAVMEVQAGNRALKDGILGKTIKNFTDMVKPEAAYFTAENGKRTAYFVFDLNDSSQLPVLTEPLFTELNAEVFMSPVMNQEDLGRGLQQVASNRKTNKY